MVNFDHFDPLLIPPKYIPPYLAEKKIFPVRGILGNFFWVFRTPSGWVLTKNWFVIMLVQVPYNSYWTKVRNGRVEKFSVERY